MSDRYGSCVPLFGGKYEWFPASRCVFVKGSTEPIATDCFNSDQARDTIRAWWDRNKKVDASQQSERKDLMIALLATRAAAYDPQGMSSEDIIEWTKTMTEFDGTKWVIKQLAR